MHSTVVNLILCEESDEIVAGALNLRYLTFSQLNLKQHRVGPNGVNVVIE